MDGNAVFHFWLKLVNGDTANREDITRHGWLACLRTDPMGRKLARLFFGDVPGNVNPTPAIYHPKDFWALLIGGTNVLRIS
ncbi:hypothetical protein TNCV_4285321 [Trichonephila clavipes]|nr:hypothetical protein TNCV_4285321 [Trichonephila clavipes]